MGRSMPKVSCVACLRYTETAVTASLRSMPNLVILKNCGSLPTSVMSVPCSVVTTFSRLPPCS